MEERSKGETWKINLPLGWADILLTPLRSTILVAPSKFFQTRNANWFHFARRPKHTTWIETQRMIIMIRKQHKETGSNWLTSKVDHHWLWHENKRVLGHESIIQSKVLKNSATRTWRNIGFQQPHRDCNCGCIYMHFSIISRIATKPQLQPQYTSRFIGFSQLHYCNWDHISSIYIQFKTFYSSKWSYLPACVDSISFYIASAT